VSQDFTKPAINDETGHCVSCGRDNSGHEGEPCSDDCPMYDAPRLTKGRAAFLRAVENGEPTNFHRSVIEPVERLGLVMFTRGFRLAGRNAFPANQFILTSSLAEMEAA
jgi:hypothetical protein